MLTMTDHLLSSPYEDILLTLILLGVMRFKPSGFDNTFDSDLLKRTNDLWLPVILVANKSILPTPLTMQSAPTSDYPFLSAETRS